MAVSPRLVNWMIFLSLALIWGSSFILIKIGLQSFSPYQVAALRILSAGLVLLPVAVKNRRKIPGEKISLIILSGLLGSFFPAFLFCIAETRIASALASILNSLTPIVTIVLGLVFFQSTIEWRKLLGVLISFSGLCILLFSRGKIALDYLSYASLVLLATICYGLNVNIVSRYLREIGSLTIAAFAFTFLIVPSFLILVFTGFFTLPLNKPGYLPAIAACMVLGALGTALASVIFYMLVKRAGIVFTSTVTYIIPFVGIFWGLLFKESISPAELICLAIILSGILVTSK